MKKINDLAKLYWNAKRQIKLIPGSATEELNGLLEQIVREIFVRGTKQQVERQWKENNQILYCSVK